ncbi:MAG: BatA domain-containing protein [bacterium]
MLTFVHTIVLVGLAGVVLPIVIHLFARQKVQKIAFSSTVFLRNIQSQKMRRMKLRQMVLLILRCLIVFFFVMAFARPTLRTRDGLGKGRAASSAVILADNSLSMGRESLFQEAGERMSAACNVFREEDEAALLWTASSRDAEPGFTHDIEGLREALRRGDVSWERGNMADAFGKVTEILTASPNVNREIYLVGDLQATGFMGSVDSMFSSPWKGTLFVLPVSGGVENTAIVGGGVENAILQQGTPLRVFSDVKNFGKKAVENLLVRFFMRGEAAAQKEIRIGASETKRVSFQLMPEGGGWVWGSFRIEKDELIGDNEWFFTCWIPERIRVLCIGKTQEDVDPLKLALVPDGEMQRVFDVYIAVHGENWIRRIDETDMLFFSNYPSFSPDEADGLQRFVEGGGGVFFLMGDQVDLRNMTASFFVPVTGMTLGNVMGDGGREGGHLTFETVDFDHPLFEGVFEKGKENIQSPHLYRVVEVMGKKYQKIIGLSDGKPFLIEVKVGSGTVLLAASGVQRTWSDFAYSSIFAPLVSRSAAYFSSPQMEKTDVRTVGESVVLSASAEDMEASFRVVTPSGREELIFPEADRDRVNLRLPTTETPGIYRFYRGETLLGLAAVNVDPKESDFRPVSEERLKKMFPEARIEVVHEAEALESRILRTRWGRELWRECLLLGALILIVEMLIAREGRKTSLSESL